MKALFGIVVLGALTGAAFKNNEPSEKPCCPPELLFAQAGQPTPYKNKEGKLFCPVMKAVVASEKAAVGFSDYKGTRYYFCCGGCKPLFDKDPAKYVAESKPAESKQPEILEAKFDKYHLELWPPEDGVYAGEEIDIEFGVFDSTKKEADGGLAGVADVEVKAEVTMPSMPGMPVQKPHIHKEGRAGVFGLELFFPHGGEYQIDLTVTPKGGKPGKATFKINVADEKPEGGGKKPYELQIVDFPADAKPGQPVDLKMKVVETKTGSTAKDFEVVHEQKFHLLIASKDLSIFMHEHPEMAEDGTWTYRATFPTGGEYMVYGDVAPNGKGSRILIGKVKVEGTGPSVPLTPHMGPSKDGGLVGVLAPAEIPIPIGKMTSLRVKLTDEKTGLPAGDTEPWLGAAGHLMIIHQDGDTIVHSHPHEDAESAANVKKGLISFDGRFPKPGLYRAYAQFKRGGQIKTIGFTIDVK